MIEPATYFEWMKKVKQVLNKPNPYTPYFPKCLTNLKTLCWVPKQRWELHPYLQCVYFLIHGKRIARKGNAYAKFKEFLQIQDFWSMGPIDFNRIAVLYEARVEVFQQTNIVGGRELTLRYVFNPTGKRVLKLYNNTQCDPYHSWMAMIPGKGGKCRLEDYKYCTACGRWIVRKFDQHIAKCVQCICGSSYTKGDTHNLHCKYAKKGHTKLKPKRSCQVYVKEKNDFNISNCYFGDFETLIGNRGHHNVYGSCCVDYQEKVLQPNKNIWLGEDALDKMMLKITNEYNGVFWFFNGSRFDLYFVKKWCIRNKIQISKVILQGSAILSMTIETRVGEVVFRDLNRFLPGSLDANCTAFELDVDQSKQQFDHMKIKGFNDVKTHYDEIQKYLWMDVISLRTVYEKYAKVVHDSYGLTVAKFVTGSHLGYGIFTTFLPKTARFQLLKTPLCDEAVMREQYRGGRVICGRPIWKTIDWDKVIDQAEENFAKDEKTKEEKPDGWKVSQELYDSIEDYYCYIDCNSLYPAAQVGRTYPIGEHLLCDVEHDLHWKWRLKKSLNTRDPEYKQWWMQASAKVDIECPNDLIIPFLMEKDDQGNVRQNLLSKKKVWYTGPELWEASKLGYTITNVYAFCYWKNNQKIFDDFVNTVYKAKKAAKRDTPPYTEAKNTLNAVTGKFGQRLRTTEFHIFGKDEVINVPLFEMSEILDDDDELLGWSGKSEKVSDFCPYPIQLSAFILAHSKVIMSKILRKMGGIKKKEGETPQEKLERMKGGYLETDLAPIYGDTDSLLVHNHMFARYPDSLKGDMELGHMKLEINGKIIGVIVLAPKTYHVVYIDAKTKKLMSITKSKGIPHGGKPYNAFETFTLSSEDRERNLRNYEHLKKREDRKEFCKNVNIKDRAYLTRRKTGELVDITSKLSWDKFEGMVNGDYIIEAIFGGMVRDMGNGLNLNISNDFALRTANATDYWVQGMSRRMMRSDYPYPTSLPIGHYLIPIEHQLNSD